MTTPATMTNCPTEETLAAFIDGRLEGDASKRVIEHIAGCVQCRDIVNAARELESEGVVEPGNVRQFPPRRSYVPSVIAAIAASIIVLALIPQVREWVRFTSKVGFAPVKTAYPSIEERRVESRLSGLPYKKLKPRFRGKNEEADDLLDMMIVADKLERAASKDYWKEQHQLALAQINIGNRKEALHAIELAEQQAGGASDAGFLNDAAAVYLECAQGGPPEDRARALKAAERAWARAKTPESAWNRALAYEMNNKTAEAVAAWNGYLAMDRTSEWAKEAQHHLDNLKILAQP